MGCNALYWCWTKKQTRAVAVLHLPCANQSALCTPWLLGPLFWVSLLRNTSLYLYRKLLVTGMCSVGKVPQ